MTIQRSLYNEFYLFYNEFTALYIFQPDYRVNDFFNRFLQHMKTESEEDWFPFAVCLLSE